MFKRFKCDKFILSSSTFYGKRKFIDYLMALDNLQSIDYYCIAYINTVDIDIIYIYLKTKKPCLFPPFYSDFSCVKSTLPPDKAIDYLRFICEDYTQFDTKGYYEIYSSNNGSREILFKN